MADAYKNFAYSTVATAPSPATTGTSLVVAAGEGARFPAVPFNAVIWPDGENPLPSNSEIVRVTGIATDTLTIVREQEGTTARTVIVGDQISAPMTAKIFNEDFLPKTGGDVTGPTSFTDAHFKGMPWVNPRHPDFNASGEGATTTTGSINIGVDPNLLTVASISTWVVGQGIYIVGAGVAGAVLETWITAIDGSDFTLNDAASTSVTDQEVGHSDTRAIQAAIDFAMAGGGRGAVFNSKGRYNISQLSIPGQCSFVGAGRIVTEFYSIPGNTSDYMLVNDAVTDFWITLRDFGIHGNKSATPAPTCGGIEFDNTGQTGDRQYLIANVHIRQCAGTAIHLVGAARANFLTNIYTVFNDGHGIHIDSGGATDNLLLGVYTGQSGLHGIFIQSGANAVQGCTSFNSGRIDSVDFGDNFHIAQHQNNIAGCKSLDADRHGVNIAGNMNSVEITCDTNEGDHFRHTSGNNNRVRGICQTSVRHTADSVLNFISGTNNNYEIEYAPTALGATAPVIGAGLGDGGNRIVVRNGGGVDIVPYAASITPDPYASDTILVTSITGNLTINNTTYKHAGQVLKFILTQDGTGGHTISFGTDFDLDGYTPITAPNGISRVGFLYDGTKWRRG